MKWAIQITVFSSLLAILVLPLLSADSSQLPNIVLIYADDLGFSDLGCYGAEGIKTPHIDRLAAEGTRFTSFYVAQPVCTASRAALMSGCYSNRISLFGALNHQSNVGIPESELLLPEICKSRGYATAIFGKWHLGHREKFLPLNHGFDEFLGLPYSNDNGPLHPIVRDIPSLPLIEGNKTAELDPDQSQFTRRFTERAVEFIERNKERPFFLYVPHVMPHVPIFASERFRGRSKAGLYGDVIEELDWSVGEILAAIQRCELDARTLIIFASDNGPFLSYGNHAGTARPLREGKLTTFEGGVRVPCLMRWPSKVPAGRTTNELAATIDLVPTIARLTGHGSRLAPRDDSISRSEMPTIDGVDIWPLISGEGKSPRETFYYYAGDELQAVRSGAWKLHLPHEYLTPAQPPGKDGKPANFANLKPESMQQSGLRGIASRHGYLVKKIELSLFNLDEDVSESRNVAEQHPQIVEQLQKLAEQARAELGDSLTKRTGDGVRPCGSVQPPPTEEVKYDLLIQGGQIIDGSGNPWFRGDVAVRGDTIVGVGRIPAGTAKRRIDARGLVVAPGFIDMHSHSDTVLLEEGLAQSKIRQGVTTEVLGEGTSAGPRVGKLAPQSVLVAGKPVEWRTLGEYFRAIEEAKVSVNVASYVGLDNVWKSVLGESQERPTPEQLAEMQKLVAAAMDEGAMGLSTMLAMPPGSLATTDDLVKLCEPVAKRGGIFSTHNRNEGMEVFDAIKEAIAVGERAGVPVDIIHVKIADQQYWGRMGEIIELIEAARARGVDVQTNVYPYTRGNNNLASIVPPWAHDGGKGKLLERLKDTAERQRMKKDIRGGIAGWYKHFTAVGGDWSRMLISGKGQFEGLTMDRVIALRTKGIDPPPDSLDVLFDLLIEEGGSISTVYAHHTEADMNLALRQPWCSIGSDGSALSIEGELRRGNPHPRNFGTFPRVLGVYVREQKLLSLEEAVRKMTSLNAAKLGLRERGFVREGLRADITLFNPATVIDKATYTAPFAYNEGIEYVIVNGEVVLDRGEHTGAKPGRVLRRR
jgi:N-acyl-D-aspartate/D-glutamate deacylase/arylsulfatase A-like enzyme